MTAGVLAVGVPTLGLGACVTGLLPGAMAVIARTDADEMAGVPLNIGIADAGSCTGGAVTAAVGAGEDAVGPVVGAATREDWGPPQAATISAAVTSVAYRRMTGSLTRPRYPPAAGRPLRSQTGRWPTAKMREKLRTTPCGSLGYASSSLAV